MNLLLFSSKNMQKKYFLTNFELVTTFFQSGIEMARLPLGFIVLSN